MSIFKIIAGLGSIDDYEEYAAAGADELFIGYVPESYLLKHGVRMPFNRREVIYYNVQIGSESELLILGDMMARHNVPVTITLNSLHYERELYPEIIDYVRKCMQYGFERFIIADLDLLEYMTGRINDLKVCVSGEYGEYNEGVFYYFQRFPDIFRIIFPRQTTIAEMKMLAGLFPQYEYEAFLLNEKCHFTGAYCNSLHCDELCHMCKLPYLLCEEEKGTITKGTINIEETDCNQDYAAEKYVTGASGCGLCALWKLRDAGVRCLKLVSRGNGTEETAEDIKKLRKAICLLEDASSESDYINRMKNELFPHGCSGNCYYDLFKRNCSTLP